MSKRAARQHSDRLMARISADQLDGLLSALSVEFVRLTECLVSPGWRLSLGGTPAPGMQSGPRRMPEQIVVHGALYGSGGHAAHDSPARIAHAPGGHDADCR